MQHKYFWKRYKSFWNNGCLRSNGSPAGPYTIIYPCRRVLLSRFTGVQVVYGWTVPSERIYLLGPQVIPISDCSAYTTYCAQNIALVYRDRLGYEVLYIIDSYKNNNSNDNNIILCVLCACTVFGSRTRHSKTCRK